MRAIVGALLAVPSVAGATTGLEWKFDAPVRYHLDVGVELPQAMRVNALQNQEARITGFEIALATTCKAMAPLKTGWEVGCLLDAVALRAVPASPDQGLLLPILVEWDELLTGATVLFEFGKDGKIRDLEVTGIETPSADRRAAEIKETMRLMMMRAFGPLDLQLPKKGDDGGKGAWRQRETLILAFPSSIAAIGSAVVGHEITEETGDLIDLRTEGHGVLGSGDSVTVQGSERIANMYDLRLEGVARFDRATGRLISRDYTARGTLTASSMDAATGAGSPYVQRGSLRWLVDDAPIPDLGPTGEVAEAHGPELGTLGP